MANLSNPSEDIDKSNQNLLSQYPESFVHLHLHTQYSLLDGAIRLKDLITRAKELDVKAIAQTDHGNMFGAIDFYCQCKDAGIKPILGSEIYFTSGSRFDRKAARRSQSISNQDEEEASRQIHHLILLAKNNTGYANLCKLLTKAYLEGFYYKPRADLSLLSEYSEGLICTTACLKGEVGYNFFTGQDERAIKAISKLHNLFKDDFYLEIQENGIPEQKIVNEKVISYAREHNIQLVATNDCHYMTKEDATAQEVLLCIQTGKSYADENRMRMTSQEFYYKSPAQMRESFSYAPDACDNTLKIADQCNVELNWKDEKGNQIYHLPDFKIDTGELMDRYFSRISREGLEDRFKGPHFTKLIAQPDWKEQKIKYLERLESELSMIIKMGFPGYFLIVADFINWSLDNDVPVGPGRGSGAGSLVAYSLKITNINPLPFNLLFERFINPERISMPDFDIDFCQQGRTKVIEYVTQKYGSDRVSQIITFGKLQAKAAFKDVARVFDLTFSEANFISKLIPDEIGITLNHALELEPKLNELIESDPKIRQIFDIALRLEGLYRHAGIHAAGVVITNKPLVEYCPLLKGAKGEQVIQFDKNISEMIGLVKFDFLGLKTLTVIDRAVKLIQRDLKPEFDIQAIDDEDSKIYSFITRGETIGVFQLESSGMIDLCKRIKPDNLEEITAINALYRPGPLESGMVDDFIEIKHGRKQMQFSFAELEPILKDTFGVIVYQEQVMNIAREIAGYTLGGADMLRRAMGKKKVKEMERHKEIFITGARERGFNEKKASDLFDLMANFAAYGFNKSHAVAYAYIAYQTAFLKYYYPAQFFAGLLSTELSNASKITLYIKETKRYDIQVLPPDVNESLWLFNVVDKNIRFGMGAVKNIGAAGVNSLVLEREKNGAFLGFIDFCKRIDYKVINKRFVESLILVGAFDSSEKMNRKTLHSNMEIVLQYSQKEREHKELGQVSFFDLEGSEDSTKQLDINIVKDFTNKEKLSYEKELVGIYISGHPLDQYETLISDLSSCSILEVENTHGSDKRDMRLAGMIANKKNIITKKGAKMCFLNLEDLTGSIECIVFPKVFEAFEEILNSEDPILIRGKVSLNEEPKKMFPEEITLLKDHTEQNVNLVEITIALDKISIKQLDKLKQIMLSYRGSVNTKIIFKNKFGTVLMALSKDFKVTATPSMAAKVNHLLQENAVKFLIEGQDVNNI